MRLAGVMLFVALPLLLPLAEVARQPAGFRALAEADRLAGLAANTLGLTGGAVAVAVPLGAAVAVLLERGRVRGARPLRAALVCGAFVPLTVWAASWQAAVGGGLLADAGGWRPWRLGLLPAVWVHALAGVPWAYAFVALSLRTTDRNLEDDARLRGGRRAVWWLVLWPRVKLGAAAAACWVAAQAFTEVAVTDVMMVRTFAEDVYFQLVGNPDGVSAAVAATLPVWVLAAVVGVWVSRRAGRAAVPDFAAAGPPLFYVGWSGTAAVWVGVGCLVGVPLAALIRRGGGQLGPVVGAHFGTLAESVLWSAVAGLIAAALALHLCWRARDSAGGWVLAFAAAAWLTPAPLVGLGLKQAIDVLLTLEDAVLAALGWTPAFPPLRSALYDQPSPLPGIWAAVVRYFPAGVAVVWPATRRVPLSQREAARLDGGTRAEWWGVGWPHCRAAFGRAAVAVGVLALGEVVAGKLVQPPGRQSLAQELFAAMHYGADATVAALCLLQVGACAVVVLLFSVVRIR